VLAAELHSATTLFIAASVLSAALSTTAAAFLGASSELAAEFFVAISIASVITRFSIRHG
jgi:hypothetical protein